MSGFSYGDPLIYTLRSGKIGDEFPPLSESHKIINSQILLNELPVRLNRITISGYVEVPELLNGATLTSTQFICDYTLGILSFASSEEGKTITVNFTGRGVVLFPVSRIWTQQQSGVVLQTLDDLTSAASEFVHKGTYDNAVLYKVYNMVNYIGGSFICVSPTVGNNPTDTTKWRKMAGIQFNNVYSTSVTYANGDTVVSGAGDTVYQSIVDNNLNQSLTDATKWKPLISVKNAIDAATSAASSANAAATAANTAKTNADTAATAANTAKTNADTATSNANSAASSANSAASSATTATTNANNAVTNLNNAVADVIHLGPYNSATTYHKNNSASIGGRTWRALQTTVGNTPVEGVNWTLEADKGADGTGTVTSLTSTTGTLAITGTAQVPDLNVVTGSGASQIPKRDANGNLQNIGYAVINVSANTTLTLAQSGIINVTTGATPVTITLPDATTAQTVFTIKKADIGVGQVIINTTSSQTIDGVTTKSLINQYAVITVVSSGGNWLVDVPNTSDQIGLLPNLTTNSKTDLATSINETNTNKITAKSANATLTLAERGIINVATGASNLTMTLPSAATPQVRYQIKKVDNGAGTVTIATTSSQLIDGISTKTLTNQFSSIELVSDGTGWTVSVDNNNDKIGTPSQLTTTANILVPAINEVQQMPVNSLYRQAIINGNFDIWQRGTSFTNPTNGTYVADRWIATQAGGGSVTRQSFTIGQNAVPNNPTYYLNLTTTSVFSFTRITQKIEDVRTFAGQKISVSFWAKSAVSSPLNSLFLEQNFGSGGSASVTTALTPNISALTTAWQFIIATITLPSISGKTIGTSPYLELQIFGTGSTAATCNIDIAQVQANAGGVALPFQPRSFADELALCMRYYEKNVPYATAPADGALVGDAFGLTTQAANTTTLVTTQMTFKVKKRVNPTITLYRSSSGAAAGKWQVLGGGGWTDIGSIQTLSASEDGFKLDLTHSSAAFTANNVYIVKGGYAVDAEL